MTSIYRVIGRHGGKPFLREWQARANQVDAAQMAFTLFPELGTLRVVLVEDGEDVEDWDFELVDGEVRVVV